MSAYKKIQYTTIITCIDIFYLTIYMQQFLKYISNVIVFNTHNFWANLKKTKKNATKVLTDNTTQIKVFCYKHTEIVLKVLLLPEGLNQ